MRLILLGAPGSGKGTQANLLKAKYGCAHISTGDILRKNLQDKTELGLRAESFINKGELVPDAIVIDMVEERLRQGDLAKGFLMDGFPRTVLQAEAFDKILSKMECPLNAVILIKIADELVVRRLTNRRTCRSCGKILSLLNEMNEIKDCPDCGGELYQRDDDTESVIRNRLKVYMNQTKPLINWYADKKCGDKELLHVIDVDESSTPDSVFKRIETALAL